MATHCRKTSMLHVAKASSLMTVLKGITSFALKKHTELVKIFRLWELYGRGSRCRKASATDRCPLGLWMIGTTLLFSFAFYELGRIVVLQVSHHSGCGNSNMASASDIACKTPWFSLIFTMFPLSLKTPAWACNPKEIQTLLLAFSNCISSCWTGSPETGTACCPAQNTRCRMEACLGVICHVWDLLCWHMLVLII